MTYLGDFWQDVIRLNPTFPRPSTTAAIPNLTCFKCGLRYAEELVHYCPTGITRLPVTEMLWSEPQGAPGQD